MVLLNGPKWILEPQLCFPHSHCCCHFFLLSWLPFFAIVTCLNPNGSSRSRILMQPPPWSTVWYLPIFLKQEIITSSCDLLWPLICSTWVTLSTFSLALQLSICLSHFGFLGSWRDLFLPMNVGRHIASTCWMEGCTDGWAALTLYCAKYSL